jgi:hypothetical protein
MFKILPLLEHETDTKAKKIYIFKINLAVLFHILLFCIINLCDGHYTTMGT